MSARKSMDERIAEAVAAALAAYVAANPASGASASGPARSADGRDFPCTAGGACTRRLRSKARAAVHGVDAGGHEPRVI